MLSDEVTGSVAVRPKGDVDGECDMEADEKTEKEIEENAVRPKSDMDADAFDEVAEDKHENENGAAAAKNMLETNDEVSKKDEEIRRLIEERRSTSKGEKQRLKDFSKQIRKCIRDKKEKKTRNDSEYSKISKGSRTFQESNLRTEGSSSPRKNEKGENHYTKKGNCQCLWRIPQKTL